MHPPLVRQANLYREIIRSAADRADTVLQHMFLLRKNTSAAYLRTAVQASAVTDRAAACAGGGINLSRADMKVRAVRTCEMFTAQECLTVSVLRPDFQAILPLREGGQVQHFIKNAYIDGLCIHILICTGDKRPIRVGDLCRYSFQCRVYR